MSTDEMKLTYDLNLFPPAEEPIFAINNTCNWFLLTDDARKETLELLKIANLKNMRRRIVKGMKPFLAISADAVYTTSYLCDYFSLSTPIKYLALDMFDRFFMNHVSNLQAAVAKRFCDPQAFDEQWEKISLRIERQSLLRLLSCIQLASKVIDRNQILTSNKILLYLKKNEHRFNLDGIVNSEVRVGQTLNFELEIMTAYSALESLLGLRRSPKLILLAPQIFSLGVQLLEMLYMRHHKIYNMLFQCIGITSSDDDDEWQEELRQMRSELDNLWASAAIIIASLAHVNIGLQEIAIEELAHDLKGVRSEYELRAFAWVINKCFTSETTINES